MATVLNFPSDQVRSFYERLPYPEPLANLERHVALYQNPERRRARFHLMFPAGNPRARQQILVAGCGTSQAATVAIREAESRVVAIDISEASLRHTRQLQRKYALDNLELRQLSILDIEGLGETFDQIICTGVLHHLNDPELGLQSLRDVLAPDGAMQIMVYASYGRSGICMMQEYCRLLGVTPSTHELHDLGATLNHLPQDHPLAPVLHRARDFNHPDALADAMLNPRDCAYSVPQLFEWLDRCSMSFGRWFEQAPYLPQCGAIAKTPHAKRLYALPEAQQYAAMELFRGTLTQHKFVAYRSDRAQARQSIQFTGEQWRSYVPIRLPWTACVREPLSPGSAAVLLNPAHRHPDLILPINASEDRILEQLDGKRTLGEIAASGGDAALRFVRQLWQYDQIVFDAAVARVVEPCGL
jgi:SAM-dependent methyltransferase